MPPPRTLLIPRLPGFICRSCLARSRAPEPSCVRRSSRNAVGFKEQPGRKGLRDRILQNPALTQKEPNIRYFDETPDGDRREILDNPEEEAFLASLKTSILELEKDLGDYKPSQDDIDAEAAFEEAEDGPWRPPEAKGEGVLADNIDSEIEDMQAMLKRLKCMLEKDSLSAEDILKIREDVFQSELTEHPPKSTSKALRLAPGKWGEAFDSSDTSVSIQPVIPLDAYPEEYSQNISLLNDSLRRASQGILEISNFKGQGKSSAKYSKDGHLTRDIHRRLWKCYIMIRKAVLAQPERVPQTVWSVLWDVVSEQSATNIDQIAHVRQLGADMYNAGLQLQDSQRLKYMESLLVHGDAEAALQQWEIGEESLRSKPKTCKKVWELEARIRSKLGQVDLALLAAEKFFGVSEDATDGRILLPIIQASLSSSPHKTSVAWSLYGQLKSRLGHSITMDDYDIVTMLFLNANKPDLALTVFKDMMLTGDKPRESIATATPTSVGKASLALAKSGELGIDWEKSRALSALPSKFDNKYFFGSWIKKLIGDQELDAAKIVLDLMRERGICPDARHVNGLIGAWFREGSVGSRRLAEDMAWTMIRTRLDFVKARDMKYRLETPLKVVRTEGKSDHKELLLVPKATIETFSVLVHYYRQSRKQDSLIDLFNTIERARIRPDTFFMNQLIMVDAKSEQMAWAWDTYCDLVRNHGVVPDFGTYAILWAFMKTSVNSVLRLPSIGGFPRPRDLFAEMMRCDSLLQAKEPLPQPLYELVIQSFCISKDLAGTAVAVKALRQKFGIYASEATVRNIVLQVALTGHKSRAGPRYRRVSSKISPDRTAVVAEVLQAMKDARVNELLQQGIVFDDMTGEEKLEETSNLVSQLLGHVAQTRLDAEGGGEISELAKVAAEEMSVPECACWS